MLQPLRRPLARVLVRQREKHNLRPGIADQLPVERKNLRLLLAFAQRKLRMHLLQRNAPARRVVGNPAQKQRLRLRQPRVRQQQTRQFPARISAHSGYSRAHRRRRLLAARLRWRFEFRA